MKKELIEMMQKHLGEEVKNINYNAQRRLARRYWAARKAEIDSADPYDWLED